LADREKNISIVVSYNFSDKYFGLLFSEIL